MVFPEIDFGKPDDKYGKGDDDGSDFGTNIDIMKTLAPTVGDDISKEIIKSLNKEYKPVFGIKKAMEDDAIVSEFINRKQRFPEQTNKEICEDLSTIFKRSNSENIRKVLEKAKVLPLKKWTNS